MLHCSHLFRTNFRISFSLSLKTRTRLRIKLKVEEFGEVVSWDCYFLQVARCYVESDDRPRVIFTLNRVYSWKIIPLPERSWNDSLELQMWRKNEILKLISTDRYLTFIVQLSVWRKNKNNLLRLYHCLALWPILQSKGLKD